MLMQTVRYMRALLGVAKQDEGVTAVEYAVMVTAIALVVIVAALFLGHAVAGLFDTAGSSITSP